MPQGEEIKKSLTTIKVFLQLFLPLEVERPSLLTVLCGELIYALLQMGSIFCLRADFSSNFFFADFSSHFYIIYKILAAQ